MEKGAIDELAGLIWKLSRTKLNKGCWDDVELQKIILLLHRLDYLQQKEKGN